MSITSTIDLVAGMIFIYFILSLVCNSLFEAISAWRGLRAKLLEDWIRTSFPAIAEKFFDHTLINGLSVKGKSTNYISAQNFSNAFIEIVSSYSKDGAMPKNLWEITQMLDYFNDPANPDKSKANIIPQDLQRALRLFIAQAQAASTPNKPVNELQMFQKSIEKWFDSMMERITGNYKRTAMAYTIVIATLLTVALNINSVSLVQYLAADDTARTGLSQAAYKAANDPELKNESDNIKAKNNASETDSVISTRTVDSTITISTRHIKHADSLAGSLGNFIPIGWTGNEFKTFEILYGYIKKDITQKPVAKAAPPIVVPYDSALIKVTVNYLSAVKTTPVPNGKPVVIDTALNGAVDNVYKSAIASAIKASKPDTAQTAELAVTKPGQQKTPWTAMAVFALYCLFGWAITIFALTLGAPFWFDLLGQIASIRSSIKPATSAQTDATESAAKKKDSDSD